MITTRELEYAVYQKFYKSTKGILVRSLAGMVVNHEADILLVSKNLYLTEIEIKISISDLRKEANKKHNHIDPKIKRLYFLVPTTILGNAIKLIPKDYGILEAYRTVRDTISIREVREPKVNKEAIKISQDELINIYRLQSLRYWETLNQNNKLLRRIKQCIKT
jgi:hypothetical protein